MKGENSTAQAHAKLLLMIKNTHKEVHQGKSHLFYLKMKKKNQKDVDN